MGLLKAKKFVYTSDFRGRFHINIACSQEQNFLFLYKKTLWLYTKSYSRVNEQSFLVKMSRIMNCDFVIPI
jgi:hypothetical protein